MSNTDLSVSQPHPNGATPIEKLGLAIAAIGMLIMLVAMSGVTFINSSLYLTVALTFVIGGTVIYSASKYLNQPKGIKNNGIWQHSVTNRGVAGYMIGIFLTGLYVVLYWFPQYIGTGGEDAANTGLVALFDPLSKALNGHKADEWFVYGSLYSMFVLALGIKFSFKYRHNRYQLIRTCVVVIIQLSLAYIIPEIISSLKNGTGDFNKDIKNFWPLNYEFFTPESLEGMRKSGGLGMLFLVTGILLFAVVAPIVTYFVGKRWYCSWVCGCGGLAETAGDPFRQLSSKKVYAWKIERWLVHGVLVFVTVMTIGVLYSYFTGKEELLGLNVENHLRAPYGFFIGSIFSGIIGVGFYPIMGNRVWCRFGCPLAAYMGIIQRFKSRFRITTNGGQCISCGNCSTYCEQGIDVRWYAQRGQDVSRASCVGCGICSAVCPRGVLKLENGSNTKRVNEEQLLINLLNEKRYDNEI